MGEVAADGVSWIRRKMSKKCLGDEFWGSPGVAGKISKKRQKNVLGSNWSPAGLRQNVKHMTNKCQQKCPQTFSGHFFDILKPFW